MHNRRKMPFCDKRDFKRIRPTCAEQIRYPTGQVETASGHMYSKMFSTSVNDLKWASSGKLISFVP